MALIVSRGKEGDDVLLSKEFALIGCVRIFWIMGRIRSCRFLIIFTVAFLICLAHAEALTLQGTL